MCYGSPPDLAPPSSAGDPDPRRRPARRSPAAAGDGSSSGPAAPAAVFPATVTHEYGQTVVEEAPERVVSLGYTDQDAILALGTVPVAIREFTGNRPSATWPWAADKLKGEQPQVLPAGRGHAGRRGRAGARPDRRDHREPDPRAVRRLLEDRADGRRTGGRDGRRRVLVGRDEADRRGARPARRGGPDRRGRRGEVRRGRGEPPRARGRDGRHGRAEPDGPRVGQGVELERPARAVPQGARCPGPGAGRPARGRRLLRDDAVGPADRRSTTPTR